MPTPRTVKSTCKFCGEFCCKSGQIAIFKEDRKALNKWLELRPALQAQFRDRQKQIAGFSTLSVEGGCVFLDKAGDCMVYDSALPRECKHYPLIPRIVGNKLVLAITRDCPLSDVPALAASIDAAVKDFEEIPDKVWVQFSLEYKDESPKIVRVIKEIKGLPIVVRREKKKKDDNYGTYRVVARDEPGDALPRRVEGSQSDVASGGLCKGLGVNDNFGGEFGEGEEADGESDIPPHLD
jgi:Fe-S-cluster containining protein